MRILAIDFGDARTGIAVSDLSGTLASPLTVITERDMGLCAAKAAQLALREQAGLILVGDPLNMDGSVGRRGDRARDFARLVERRSGLPVKLWDERLTSVEASEILVTNGRRGKKRKALQDAVAAALILESYIAEKDKEDKKL